MKTFKTILKVAGLMICIVLAVLSIAGLIATRESKQPESTKYINPKEGKKLSFKKHKKFAYDKHRENFTHFRRHQAVA